MLSSPGAFWDAPLPLGNSSCAAEPGKTLLSKMRDSAFVYVEGKSTAVAGRDKMAAGFGLLLKSKTLHAWENPGPRAAEPECGRQALT